jgi:hypothetical protein
MYCTASCLACSFRSERFNAAVHRLNKDEISRVGNFAIETLSPWQPVAKTLDTAAKAAITFIAIIYYR